MYNPEVETAIDLAELLGKIAGITKWEYEYADEQTQSVKNGDKIWNDAIRDQRLPHTGEPNVPPDLIGDIANRQFCKLTVKLVELDNDESWHADGYNLNGYDGNTNHVVRSHKVDNVFDEYYFEQFTTATGSKP